MEGHGLSQRRACRLAGIGHSTLRYQRRRANNEVMRKRLRESAAQRRRFGYRRLGWLLAREGHPMNHKRLYRLYREERLMLRRRGGRKRALGSRTPMMVPAGINQRWSLDFVSDTRPTAAASGSCAYWTTSAATVWRQWWILPWAVCAWCGSWSWWLTNAAGPILSSAITAPN